MRIEVHGFNAVIHGMFFEEVPSFCTNTLKIPFKLFREGEFNNTKTFKYSFGKAKKSVYIRVNTSNNDGYVTLDLKGSFFDNSPDFRLDCLLLYLSQFKFTPKQLDCAFNDDKNCLNVKETLRWSRDSDYYCNGSLVARQAPENVWRNRKFRRIQLGSASSKTNYGTIYRRPKTRCIRIEVKLKEKDQIAYLLENYNDESPELFEVRSKEMLVKCINFVTMSTKKQRDPAKRKQQPSWRSFLGSDVQRINLSKLLAERRKNRKISDQTTAEKSLKRQGTMLKNAVARNSILQPEGEVLKKLEGYSGLSISKCEASM